MKRKSDDQLNNLNKKRKLTDEFVEDCRSDFAKSSSNIILKNAITNVGSLNVTTDHQEACNISHIFTNSIKKKNVKATNQGSSGRCWLFSGLNIFRHNIIKGLNLDNFEFSETYLFFWDKFERSNSFLHWFAEYAKDNQNINKGDELFKYLTDKEKWLSDGGYWNNFANLVEKYGLTPKDVMPETVHSEYSEEMNDILMNILQSAASNIFKNKKKSNKIIEDTKKQVYYTLVKFLGEPPKKFTWSFTNEDNECTVIENLTPLSFKETVTPGLNLKNFVVLVNIPDKDLSYYNKYMIRNTNNVIEDECFEMINLPINELKKYCKRSITAGLPVWFGADVNKYFNPIHSALNVKLNNNELVFGDTFKMDKETRFLFNNQQTCHAMTLIGLNFDSKNKVASWQVENSWGFYDNEQPGKDGFLAMSDKWFEEYVGQVVIHKKFLSRSILKTVDSLERIELNAWDCVTPAVKINSKRFYKYDVPKKY